MQLRHDVGHERVGRRDDARALCRESLAGLPRTPDDADASPWALFTVAWLLTRDVDELRDPVRAIRFAQRAVDLADDRRVQGTYKMLAVLALARHQSGDSAGAVETQQQVIAAIPKQAPQGVRAGQEARLATGPPWSRSARRMARFSNMKGMGESPEERRKEKSSRTVEQ